MSTTATNSWRATKLKFTGRVVGGGTPESGNPSYWDGSVPWLTPVDLGNERSDVITASKRMLTEAGVKAAGLERLPIGSVVFSTRAPIGSVGLLACEAVTNQGCKALVLDTRELDSRFCFYVALDSADMLQSLGLGTTFVELSTYSLKNLSVSIPSLDEQHRIVAYLDEQTAKIDRLMDMRRRQMALLKEQRASLIQQAVTRGLDDNVPMKDSGLPWLGEIPAHWMLAPVNARYEVQLGKMLDAAQIKGDCLAPYLRNIDVQWDSINVTDLPLMDFAPRDREKFSLRAGDLMVCEGGEIGRAAIWNEELPNCFYQKAIHRLRPRSSKDNPRFMFYLLLIASTHGLFSSRGGQATIEHLPAEALRRYRFPFAPQGEQDVIVEFLDAEGTKTDRLISAYTRQLELLTEYRAALIHECVTGQRAVPEVNNA
ncbi:MAG: restriction endonuclease subunit S [Gallionella sp.]|jgi:type I restriction enzyme S subunit